MLDRSSEDRSDDSKLYLAVGSLSLLKALALRHQPRRFRRELADAALFLGAGLLVRRLGTQRKYGPVRSQVQQRLVGRGGVSTPRERVRRLLSQEPTHSESLREQTRRVLGRNEEPRSLRERVRNKLPRR